MHCCFNHDLFYLRRLQKGGFQQSINEKGLIRPLPELPQHPNLLKAFAPLLPVVLLFVISLWFPKVKMSVATAMLIGFIYVIFVTRSNPAELVKNSLTAWDPATAASSV